MLECVVAIDSVLFVEAIGLVYLPIDLLQSVGFEFRMQVNYLGVKEGECYHVSSQ